MSRVVKFMQPVSYMSGKYAQKRVKAGLKGASVFIGTHRSKSGLNSFSTCVNYGKFKTAAAEMAASERQSKFAAVAALARTRMVDPTKMDNDIAAFEAQTKYTTRFGYLFHLEWDNYEG